MFYFTLPYRAIQFVSLVFGFLFVCLSDLVSGYGKDLSNVSILARGSDRLGWFRETSEKLSEYSESSVFY